MPVVLSYHGNTESDAALRTALKYADLLETGLVIILAQRVSDSDDRTREDAEDRLWQRLSNVDTNYEIHRSLIGREIAESVLTTADSVGADLIVIGLRSDLGGALSMGKNAQRILLESVCPVLTTTGSL